MSADHHSIPGENQPITIQDVLTACTDIAEFESDEFVLHGCDRLVIRDRSYELRFFAFQTATKTNEHFADFIRNRKLSDAKLEPSDKAPLIKNLYSFHINDKDVYVLIAIRLLS